MVAKREFDHLLIKQNTLAFNDHLTSKFLIGFLFHSLVFGF